MRKQAGFCAWVSWVTETADVRAQFIAFALVTTAGAYRKEEREGYDSYHDSEPVLHGS